MSITFTRKRSGEGLGISSDGETGTLEWHASPASNAQDVRNDPNMPIGFNSAWPDNPGLSLRCERIEIFREGRGSVWTVRGSWSIPSGGGEHTSDESEDPLSQPAEYRWDNIVITEAVDRDSLGNPILASTRRGFDPPLQKTFNAKQLTITKNLPAFDLTVALNYENTVNDSDFKGAQAGEAKCTSILPTNVYTLSATYVNIAYVFEFRSTDIFGDDPHQPRVLDQDTMAYASVDGAQRLVRILTAADGQPVDGPVPLNGRGAPINSTLYTYADSSGNAVASPDWTSIEFPPGATLESTADAVFLRFPNFYPSRNFNALGI